MRPAGRMGVRVVLDPGGGAGRRRLGRGLAAVIGTVFVVAGLVMASVPLLVVTLVSVSVASGDRPEVTADLAAGSAGLVAGALVALLVGIRFVRGRRRLVLFLRRFGLTEATAAVTFAVVKSIGRSWRLVTLDDSAVAPVGSSRGTRRIVGLATVVTVVVVASAVVWLVGGGFDSYVRGIEVTSAGDTANQSFGDAIGSAIGEGIAVGVIAGLTFAFVCLLAAFGAAGALFGGSAHRAARRAEQAKSVVIAGESAIAPATKRTADASRRVFGPRLVVARVADSVWQPTVLAFAGASAVVLVDVSEASDNLLWELRSLETDGRRRLLIGRQARVEPIDPRLAEELDGEEVVAYGEGRRALRRFARALRWHLDRSIR
ncbi:MAG: hypothetical protein ACRDY5_07050 [Acidimicrobiales bacterium]